MTDDSYTETRKSSLRAVGWRDAVPNYAGLVFRYGFVFGFGLWSLAWLFPRHGQPNLPGSFGEAVWLVLTAVMAGMAGAGFGGLLAVILKDLVYPYVLPLETTKALPRMAAPTDAKPRPFSRVMPDGRILYGKEKLEPERWHSLAAAIVQRGERQISRRKLADWGVVDDRLGVAAKQIVTDLNNLKLVNGRGNDLYEATEELVSYLSDMFPAMTPPPHLNI